MMGTIFGVLEAGRILDEGDVQYSPERLASALYERYGYGSVKELCRRAAQEWRRHERKYGPTIVELRCFGCAEAWAVKSRMMAHHPEVPFYVQGYGAGNLPDMLIT